jgi:HAD superfamily hydrolase (TIGR01509 family)
MPDQPDDRGAAADDHSAAADATLLHPPDAVIFDLDGTLVDTVDARIRAWLQVFQEERIPATRDAIAPLIGSDGKLLARRIAEAAGIELDDDDEERIDHRSGEIFNALNARPRPHPGARTALDWLTRHEIPWAIATSSRRQQVTASVEALDLPRPPTIVDGSHVQRAKPAPDLLLAAADALHTDPTACWNVGDATWDMRAAVAAGMVGIGVPSGAASPADLRSAGAATVIESLERLPDLVADVRERRG